MAESYNIKKQSGIKEMVEASSIKSGENLVKALRKFYKDQWPQFCDFHIKCQNDVLVPASKMLLSISSDYFEAFFRQQPDSTQVDISEYDSQIMTLVIKSIIDPDEKEIEANLKEFLEVADYLQMADLTTIGSLQLVDNLSQDNIMDAIDLTMKLHLPKLENAIDKFLRFHIQSDFALAAIAKLPDERFKAIVKFSWKRFDTVEGRKGLEPSIILLDAYGRRYDNAELVILLVTKYYQTLELKGKLEDFNYIGMYKSDGLGSSSDQAIQFIYFVFKSRYDHDNDNNENDLPLSVKVYDRMRKNLLETKAMKMHLFTSVSYQVRDEYWTPDFGEHPDQPNAIAEWKIEGNIRKINVKSRLWDNRHIVQGIQVFLENGTTKAFGMDLNDTLRVKSLVVPDGQHIKTVNIRSGWYIDAIGFETNTGEIVELEGGDGGSLRSRNNHHFRHRHHYIDGISGVTVMTQNAPCICGLRLKFVIII